MVCRTHDPTRSSTVSSSRPKQIISICLGDEEVKGDPLQCDLSSLSDISNKRLTSTSIRRRPCQKGVLQIGEHLKKGPPKENPLKKMVHDNQEAFLLNFNATFEDRPNFSSRIYGKFSAVQTVNPFCRPTTPCVQCLIA